MKYRVTLHRSFLWGKLLISTHIGRARVKPKGILLLEVLVAIVLLVGSVLLVLGVFPQAMTANQQGKGLLLATNLAQKEIEACKAMSIGELDFSDSRDLQFTARVHGVEQTMNFTVRREAIDAAADLKEVTITVEWKDKVGKHQTSLTTLVGAEV
jgi:Tfp pilus assembly protein PilV